MSKKFKSCFSVNHNKKIRYYTTDIKTTLIVLLLAIKRIFFLKKSILIWKIRFQDMPTARYGNGSQKICGIKIKLLMEPGFDSPR